MADKGASDSGSEDGHTIAFKIFLFILIISGLTTSFGIFNERDANTNDQDINPVLSIPENTLSRDSIELGKNITTKKNTAVRQAPGGTIIGYQRGGETGRVMEGPLDLYQTNWWRIDFKNSPDGWVDTEFISDNNFLYSTLNLFPKLFDAFKLFMFWALIFLILIVIFIISKTRKFNKTQDEKKKLKRATGLVYKPKDNQENLSQEIEEKDNDRKIKEKIDKKDDANFLKNQIENLKNGKKNQEITINNLTQVDVDISSDSDSPIKNLPVGDFDMQEFLGLSEKTEVEKGEIPKGEIYKKHENERWLNIQRLVNSHNSNDWRQAILEADIILDEMVLKMGYKGNSLGERLKNVESSNFLTLDKAWEAHKVRNRIAHRGTGYILGKDEAERVIKLYEQVFQEFFYI
jgi:cell division protein FtsL